MIAAARKIYVDSNVIIYFIEGHEEYQSLAGEFFEYVEEAKIPLVTSEITPGECLYGAYKRGRKDSVESFEILFDDLRLFHFVPVAPSLIKSAAKNGAQQRLKLIDALHFATAESVECDVFITNDKGIKSSDFLRVIHLSEL
ncbi:type II toxin-antitoxin system VapC family toxin [Pararhodospirillum photometricum]|uniref:type II toxin-antitoxin system VapC family toxin n=1 Tax=Pararhodospirillum photometricum TaxID=1084 RepID=UPI000688F4A8|nr:type II toxin-antitoxin system VapC family toxin [Pararhodospirillum photometricum]